MKQKLIYICQNCGFESPRWIGKCPQCNEWNTFIEDVTVTKKPSTATKIGASNITTLADISTDAEYRINTGITEFDRVLGGGIIPGSLVLVGGDPGIGKSTLMLQLCSNIPQAQPLYITGEESLQQIKYRSMRLPKMDTSLQLLAETNVELIDAAIKSNNTSVVIIDSIQSVLSDRIDATPGSITQVRECAMLLMQTAKKTGKAVFIIGHVTKDGSIAGPKILEHLVDTVIQFEGEKQYSYRILRCLKNRFGSTNEIGVFEMSDSGLNEVLNPSEVFLSGRNEDESGVAIVGTMEGARPILLEVQALVTPSNYGTPQRSANGYDMRRLQMILAVLEKRIGLHFGTNDVFVNIAGGVYLNDSSCDLGIAAALVSSLRDVPLDTKTVFIGEIGLTGEVRSVSALEARINEAAKLGFDRCIVPAAGINKVIKNPNITIKPIEKISSAIVDLF
ncbi:MAG: DNA repair protein RadA [Ignavibacteria bacterium]|nr:DNA repair protein RadA [Ignavibacteria bacterium]